MKISDFDYQLPIELIAQHPKEKRDQSRLLVFKRKSGEVTDSHFHNITSYLKKGDVLVVNNSKVFPARIIGKRTDTGGTVEILLNKKIDEYTWECIGKNCKEGREVLFGEGLLRGEIISKNEKIVLVKFHKNEKDLYKILEKIGRIPLPPYVKRDKNESEDRVRYQTVYSKDKGSAAAPTAGLHFTKELLQEIKSAGVEIVEITLHVGLGTFFPVEEKNIDQKKLHSEFFSVTKEVMDKLCQAKKEKRRIIAVGTTTTRVLEHLSTKIIEQDPDECSGETDIFIFPGYKFQVVDGLITNFHLPKSSLLMLVSALISREKILSLYEGAIAKKYRFFSYGDAMLILP